MLLLVGIAAAGIIFVPDSFVERIKAGADGAAAFLSDQAKRRLPEFEEGFGRKAQETAGEARMIYRSFMENNFGPALDRVENFLIFWK